jgi:hypothetical protein
MKRPKRDPVREDRIYNEAIVDARPEEQAMSWYYYLEGKDWCASSAPPKVPVSQPAVAATT